MISEVLPYLIMITCILIRVSSKEVKWTVFDTSPKLGQGLTLFCKVDNCAVHGTKRWHGGPDKKTLMSNSGISTDKTKYSTSIVQNGFILTILNLTVKDLNVSYTCSCGLDLDKHILYIEDIYTVKWTVLDTSPKLGQSLTLFCKVDNCAVHGTKKWHGGSDDKLLMLDSGISNDKAKYSTSIEKNGFILTILNLTVKDLNVSYTCSCGFDLDKHILYIEDIYTVDNLNKSTNGTNYVGTNDATGIILKITLPLLLVIILFVVFIVVMKKLGGLKKLKEMFGGSRITQSDEDGNTNVIEHDLEVVSNQRRSLGKDDNINVTEWLLFDDEIDSNQRRSLGEDDNISETEWLLFDDEVDSNQRRSLDEDDNINVIEWLLFDDEVDSNQRRSLDEDDNTNVPESLLFDDEVDSNQRRSLDEDGNTNVTESLLFDDEVDSNQRRSLVQEKIEALKLEKEECIPYNIRELHEDILNDWTKDLDMFVSTRASKRIFHCLNTYSSVTVVGNPGVGKTATMRYVALKMKMNGYTVVPTSKAEDIRNFSKKGKRTLFVIDDICGQDKVDPYRINRWQEMSEDIQQLLKNKYCKIISTCRLQIFKKINLRRLPFFKYCECNLNSQDLCLTSSERARLLQTYNEDKAGMSFFHFCVRCTKNESYLI